MAQVLLRSVLGSKLSSLFSQACDSVLKPFVVCVKVNPAFGNAAHLHPMLAQHVSNLHAQEFRYGYAQSTSQRTLAYDIPENCMQDLSSRFFCAGVPAASGTTTPAGPGCRSAIHTGP